MNDSKFDDLLKSARGDTPLPNGFKQGVWYRIERMPAITPSRTQNAWLHSVWVKGLGVAAMVALGLWLGAVSIPGVEENRMIYVKSIHPLAHRNAE